MPERTQIFFRKVPGLRVFSYDAGEIGHPFQMRGFGGSHGSDVAVYVDGVPQNLPSSVIAMNGASDVSWLASEMIDKIEVIKGPFSAFYGNQAQAGAVNFITKNSDPSPSVTVSGGSFGAFRALPIISTDAFAPTPFLAYEFSTLRGYREDSYYRRSSLFNKVTYPVYGGNASLRFNYYQSAFGVPGMLRIIDIKTGVRSRKSAWEDSDRGSQFTWSFVFNYAPADCDGGLYVDAYLENTLRERFQTWWTYGQTWSHEDRVFYGGRIYYNFLFGNVASLTLGAETRYDVGEEMEWDTVKRQVQAPQNNHKVDLCNTSLFAQGQVKLADMLKIVGGVRKDYFRNVIQNRLTPENSGTWYLETFNPKLGFVLTPLKNVNIFGNKGVGFRAPGATDFSPSSGVKATDVAVAKTETWDLGINATLLGRFFISADWYQTDMEKELRRINGRVVNLGDSQRNGYELEARCYASPQVNIFANYSWVEAKLKNPTTPGQTMVTAIPEHLIKGGIGFNYDLTQTAKFLADAYCEYTAEQPFYSGSSTTVLYSPDYVVYHFKAACKGQNWGLFAAAKYQPKEYSSNNWLGMMSGRFAITPQPLWDLTGGVKYTF